MKLSEYLNRPTFPCIPLKKGTYTGCIGIACKVKCWAGTRPEVKQQNIAK